MEPYLGCCWKTMVSEGHRKAAFSASCPTDVLKAAAATVGPSLIPVLANTSLSQLHRMVERDQPVNPQYLQQIQPCGQLTVGPSTNDFQQTNPILLGMLTRTKDSLPPKRTSQPSRRPYLEDNEIFRRIHEKLAMFKVRMQELSKPQTSTTLQTSAPENAMVRDLESTSDSQANKVAPFIARMQKLRGGSCSNKPLNSAPQTSSTSQTSSGVHPQNPDVQSLRLLSEKPKSHSIRTAQPQGKITPTKNNSAEYGHTLKEEEDSPTVLQALSGTTAQEPVKEHPGLIPHHSLADYECTLVERSYNHHQNICKAVDPLSRVDCVPAIAESALSKTPEGKAQRTSDRPSTVLETAFETTKPHSISLAGHGNLLLNFRQNKPDVTFAVTSLLKEPLPEPEQTQDLQEDQVDVCAQMEPPPSESEKSNFLIDPHYEDLTDYEEEDATEPPPAQDVYIGAEGQALGQMTVLAETPAEQEPHGPLVCTCPYFIEIDDGFEQVPCPKCEENVQFVKREVDSEDDSDSDELILFVTELDIEEVICVDSESEETEEPQDSTSEQHKRTIFQRVEEFDTFDSFFNLKVKQLVKNLPNPAGGNKPSLTEPGAVTVNLSNVKDVSHRDYVNCDLSKPSSFEVSEKVMPHCSSQNHVGILSPSPAPAKSPLMSIFQKFLGSPGPSHGLEAVDCYDTEDPLYYSSQTSSLLLPNGELPDSNILKWFPENSDEEGEENVANRVVKVTTVAPKPVKVVESDSLKTSKKAKFKSRRIIYSDSESEDNEGLENIEVSTQPPKQTLILKINPRTSEQPGLASMGFGTTGSCCVSKLGSEKDGLNNKNCPSETSSQPPEPCPKPNKYIKSRLPRIQSLKPEMIFQSNQDYIDDEEQITKAVSSQPRARKPLQLEQPLNKRQRPTISDCKSVRRLKRTHSDSGYAEQTVAKKTLSVVKTPTPETNARNASRRQKLKDLFSRRSCSLPNQSISEPPEVRPSSATEILSSGGQHPAPSLPHRNSAGQTPDSSTQRRTRKSQVKATPSFTASAAIHTSLTNAKEVNSYSTVGSTSAKKTLIQSWKDNYVPIPVNRHRTSSELAHLKDHDLKRLKKNPKPRQKHAFQELQRPLMKKTILEAKQLTNAVHCKDSPPS